MRGDSQRFWREVSERLGQFGLKLHPETTRLIEFGRFARDNRSHTGQGKPQTFDFLGFTHCCGKTRKGKFMVLRLTSAKRLRAKLQAAALDQGAGRYGLSARQLCLTPALVHHAPLDTNGRVGESRLGTLLGHAVLKRNKTAVLASLAGATRSRIGRSRT